jgi:hypothetical protein
MEALKFPSILAADSNNQLKDGDSVFVHRATTSTIQTDYCSQLNDSKYRPEPSASRHKLSTEIQQL